MRKIHLVAAWRLSYCGSVSDSQTGTCCTNTDRKELKIYVDSNPRIAGMRVERPVIKHWTGTRGDEFISITVIDSGVFSPLSRRGNNPFFVYIDGKLSKAGTVSGRVGAPGPRAVSSP